MRYFFFDDLKHEDLYKNVENYIQVPEYTFMASFDRIANVYRDIVVDKEFINVINNDKIKNIDDVIEIFRSCTEIEKIEKIEKIPDIGIDMMINSIKKIGILGKRKVVL